MVYGQPVDTSGNPDDAIALFSRFHLEDLLCYAWPDVKSPTIDIELVGEIDILLVCTTALLHRWRGDKTVSVC